MTLRRIGYVVSQYPTLGHTFIFREIAGLRQLGLHISVASALTPDREAAALTATEHAEYERCYYIRQDMARWLLLHLKTLFQNPGGYLSGLSTAIRCSQGSIPQFFRNIRDFGEAVAVGHWAQRENLDHLHAHFNTFTVLLANRIFKTPFSLTLHGPAEFVNPVGQSLCEKLRAALFAIAISYYSASQIMLFSDTLDWPKVRIVPLGIDPADFPFAEPKARMGPFRIISVGRLAPVKAHAVLLRAYAMVRAKHPDTELTVIGVGPELAALRQLAQDLAIPVEFTGGMPNELVGERVAQSHCFALASFAEGVPVVLMEAMALGIPCVATRVMGVSELIEHNEEGLLVAPGDVAALADSITTLIEHPELGARFRLAARAKVLKNYDLAENIPKLLAQFQAEGRDRERR